MSVFSAPAFDGHELVASCADKTTGLPAIIAVHNSTLGPGLGGCRMYAYASDDEALHDVLRLSRGMTYKSALAGLPLGGGKSVIIGDPRQDKSPALLEAMGDFIESQGGRYVAAEDSGTGVADIRLMAGRTAYVSGLDDNEYGGDPSPSTAYGVFLGIRTAVRHRLGVDSLSGLSVAIQGLGHVGYYLARHLVADVDHQAREHVGADAHRAGEVLVMVAHPVGDQRQHERFGRAAGRGNPARQVVGVEGVDVQRQVRTVLLDGLPAAVASGSTVTATSSDTTTAIAMVIALVLVLVFQDAGVDAQPSERRDSHRADRLTGAVRDPG